MLYETSACIYNKRMLITQDCVKFCGYIAGHRFLINNFADFSNVVQVKNQDFVQSLVAFGISNTPYSNHITKSLFVSSPRVNTQKIN